MTNSYRLLKSHNIFTERVDSLREDGYRVQFIRDSLEFDFWIAHLIHHSNGNRIIITADIRTNRMQQKTNRILTYDKPILVEEHDKLLEFV